MSFGDIGNGSAGMNKSMAQGNAINALSNSLRLFQRNCQAIKDKTTEMRRRQNVSAQEKADLDTQIKGLKEIELKIKKELDRELNELENLPRSEVASRRAALGKLQKDFERIKVVLPTISSDATLIKVNRDGFNDKGAGQFKRTNNGGGNSGWLGKSNTNGSNGDVPGLPSAHGSDDLQQQQQQKLQPLMKEQDIDAMIIEERNRDILKLNEDLRMVNEMFNDMADIVDRQGGQIDEIHQSVEASHVKAEEGLEQVKQASNYQPGCSIC